MDRLKDYLFRPVDIASLVFFRVVFGFIMLVEVLRYFTKGWIERYYIEPAFYFKYYGFSWVEPWPGSGMYWHFLLLGMTAFMIMIGLFYRAAAIAFFFLFSYVFLLDQAHYLNHFYLVILLSALLCVVPANRAFSVDSLIFPQIRSPALPAWTLWVFIVQMEVMYLYAGIVKINPDWLRLQPLEMWLGWSTDFPLIGPLFEQQWAVAVAAYGVILLHIVGAPLLLFKRTRLWVFALYAGFHTTNHFLFHIGIFPWLALAGTTLFFEPNWPRRLHWKLTAAWARYGGNERCRPVQPGDPGKQLESALVPARTAPSPALPGAATQYLIMGLIGVWLAWQILFPLRHLLYPGSPSWTEEGHRFAWQMKLRDKRGNSAFILTDPVSGKTWRASPREHLTGRQLRKMTCRPDMVLQFAHYLADTVAVENGGIRPEVRVLADCSLNGRRSQPLIDSQIDLAKVERSLKHAPWIWPLIEPLR